jgi:dipeptidyl-peptidase-4
MTDASRPVSGHVQAGVAGAPVTDYHLYDTHCTERYLGTPAEGQATGYRTLTYAGAIRDRLMIMHGWRTTTSVHQL